MKPINQDASSFQDLVANSDKMQALIATAKKFALLDAPLLIQGETGTGKELLARACHHLSQRKKNKFIAINCAGLPAEDAESEMFGRAGAGKKNQGFFEYANGGCVLLDNVEELSLPLQAKLLRFLNDGTFRRVGEEKEHFADVRVICTSQIPLQHHVEEGKVRGDLFYRLNVLSLQIPPLRERKEDIPSLVQIFLQQISQQLGIAVPQMEEGFLSKIENHPWLGNARELYNALYRACSLAENQLLRTQDLALLEENAPQLNVAQFGDESLEQIMMNFESAVLAKFYQEFPSTRKLATRLGVSHTAIANKLRLYGISK